jgi:hypothetical protein
MIFGVARKKACYRLVLRVPGCGGSLRTSLRFTRMCLLLGCCLCRVAVARFVPRCALPACVGGLPSALTYGLPFLLLSGCLLPTSGSRHPSSALPTRGATPPKVGTHPACRHPLKGARESGLKAFLSPTGSRLIMTSTVVTNRTGRIIFLWSTHAATILQPHKCIKLTLST